MDDVIPVALITGAVMVLVMVASWLGTRPPPRRGPSSGLRKGHRFAGHHGGHDGEETGK